MSTDIMLGCQFFTNGIENSGRWLAGHDANGNAVVRYKFRTPATGAFALYWAKWGTTEYDGTPRAQGEELRFYISADPNSHINAGPDAEYHGTAWVLTPNDSPFSMTGEAHGLLLLPNTDYYLFIFPGFSSYGLYYWDYYWSGMDITLGGSAGVMRIKEGSQELIATPMVKKNSELVPLAATVKSGSDFQYCG